MPHLACRVIDSPALEFEDLRNTRPSQVVIKWAGASDNPLFVVAMPLVDGVCRLKVFGDRLKSLT